MNAITGKSRATTINDAAGEHQFCMLGRACISIALRRDKTMLSDLVDGLSDRQTFEIGRALMKRKVHPVLCSKISEVLSEEQAHLAQSNDRPEFRIDFLALELARDLISRGFQGNLATSKGEVISRDDLHDLCVRYLTRDPDAQSERWRES